MVDSGKAEAFGVSYTPVWQGWLVPRYMIEGDAERGIQATMPGFEDVFDLADYWELFEDPEDSSKGRFFKSKAMWIGFAIAGGINLINGLHALLPAFPEQSILNDNHGGSQHYI